MRSVAAGVALPLTVALVLMFVSQFDGDTDGDGVAASRVTTEHDPVTAPQSASIDLVRGVAKRDLAGEGARLASCEGPSRPCWQMPLAHIAFGSRAAAGMLTGLATGLPLGECRALVLGSGTVLVELSSDADELWRGLGDRSRSGRRTSAQRSVSIRGLIEYVIGTL